MKIITAQRAPRVEKNRGLGSLTKLITVFFVLGVVTGSIVDPSVYAGISAALNTDVIPDAAPSLSGAFRGAALTLIPFEIGMLVLAMFTAGWLLVPILTAFRGFELGVLLRHIFTAAPFLHGLPYIILGVLPGAVFSSVLLILLAVDSVKLSGNLFMCVTSHGFILDMPALMRGYILKFSGYAILLACSGIIDLLAVKLFLATKF